MTDPILNHGCNFVKVKNCLATQALRPLAMVEREDKDIAAAAHLIVETIHRFDDARAIINDIWDRYDKFKARITLATAQASVGLFKDAQTTINDIENPLDALPVLLTLALAQAQADLLPEAKKIFKKAKTAINKFENTIIKSKWLANLAAAQANAHLFKDAETTIDHIEYSVDKFQALIALATAQAKADLLSKARKTFEKARNTVGIATILGAYTTLAAAQANARLFDDARGTIKDIPPSVDKLPVFVALATAQANARLFDDAEATIDNDITHPLYKSQALTALAAAQAEAGQLPESEETFKKAKTAISGFAKPGSNEYQLRTNLAAAQAKAGLFKDARATIDGITDPDDKDDKLQALLSLAVTQAKADRSRDAQKTFKAAITSIKSIKDHFDKYKALRNLAVAQETAGLSEDAKATINNNNIADFKTLFDLAMARADAAIYHKKNIMALINKYGIDAILGYVKTGSVKDAVQLREDYAKALFTGRLDVILNRKNAIEEGYGVADSYLLALGFSQDGRDRIAKTKDKLLSAADGTSERDQKDLLRETEFMVDAIDIIAQWHRLFPQDPRIRNFAHIFTEYKITRISDAHKVKSILGLLKAAGSGAEYRSLLSRLSEQPNIFLYQLELIIKYGPLFDLLNARDRKKIFSELNFASLDKKELESDIKSAFIKCLSKLIGRNIASVREELITDRFYNAVAYINELTGKEREILKSMLGIYIQNGPEAANKYIKNLPGNKPFKNNTGWLTGPPKRPIILGASNLARRQWESENGVLEDIKQLLGMLKIEGAQDFISKIDAAIIQETKRDLEGIGREIRHFLQSSKEKGLIPQTDQTANNIMNHLNDLRSLSIQALSKGETLTAEIATDPVDILNLGAGFESCLRITRGNLGSYAKDALAYATDLNKRVLYVKDNYGRVRARIALVLSDKGIVQISRLYFNVDISLQQIVPFLKEYANFVGVPLYLKDDPKDKQFKAGQETHIISKAVSPDFYGEHTNRHTGDFEYAGEFFIYKARKEPVPRKTRSHIEASI